MDDRIRELKDFLDNAHSVYHATAAVVWELEAAGYQNLGEGTCWDLVPGGKYYVSRGGSSVIAFRLPQQVPTGFMMTAAHTDRPGFKLKERAELHGAYTRLAVEGYGGMIMHTWLDRPLSIAGRVVVQTAEGIESRLIDIDRDLLMIPNLAIHMNRQVNDGYKWNPAVDLLPMMGGKSVADKLDGLIQDEAGARVLGRDLYLYVRQNASIWGMYEEFLSAPALDDLLCLWCCTRGFLDSRDSRAVPVLCLFDGEEVGSQTQQGAGSDFLQSVLMRVCRAMQWDPDRMLSQSFMISADNAHGLHPNHPEMADPSNAPVLGDGIVLKFNSSMQYTTDGMSAAVIRRLCERLHLPLQTYFNRADIRGGSTLGHISLGHVSVLSADIGLPQLAMHSCYETAAVQDVLDMTELLTEYYSVAVDCPSDGICHIG